MKLIKISIFLLLTIATFSACQFNFGDGKSGNGNVIKEQRKVTEEFDQVKASRGLEIILTVGESNTIEVESDENLQKNIVVSISNGRLEITTDENLSGNATKKVYVTYKNINNIDASSGSEIKVLGQLKNETLTLEASSGASVEADIFAKEVNLKASSGADITVSGKASQLIAKASSGSEIDGEHLKVVTAKADASSGGEITVYVQDRIDSKATSGGEVNYYGNPKETTANDSSSGSIHKR